MDGSLALKYARSRHALGVEGSDFARAKRQQKLIVAVQDKVLSYKTFLNPQKIIQIMGTLNENVKTNLSVGEIVHLIKLSKEIDMNKVVMRVLDNSPEGPLMDNYTEISEGVNMYALTTKSGNFSEIKNIADNIFMEAQIKGIMANAAEERAKVAILNGTKISGWAYQTSLDLQNLNLEIIKIGNAAEQDKSETVIYSPSPDNFTHTLDALQKKLGAKVTYKYPLSGDNTGADIVIVLGKGN